VDAQIAKARSPILAGRDEEVKVKTVRDEQQPVRSEIEKILCSDVLPKLKEILEVFPAFRSVLPQLLQLAAVIDANIVRGELWWRLKNRPRPELRSSLEEALARAPRSKHSPTLTPPMFCSRTMQIHFRLKEQSFIRTSISHDYLRFSM